MPVSNSGEAEPCRCAACGEPILERYYLLAVDKQWHVSCLKCSQCHLSLDSQLTCFAKDGQIYCKHDYYRLFGVKRCARCDLGISANEMVMRARDLVYHLTCFSCASCDRPLTTGDHFGLRDRVVYCDAHYDVPLSDEFPLRNVLHSLSGPATNAAQNAFYNGVGATQKGRPRKRKSQAIDSDMCLMQLGVGQQEGDPMKQDIYQDQQMTGRQKRMRTSFKHHQLRTMKSYFSLNHNPDTKDLKQLAQKTGLNKRVLQVWFQNARAKYRRNLLKGQGKQSGDEGELKTGGSRHEASLSELSSATSPAMSDSSSTPSLPDMTSSSRDESIEHLSNSNLTELFSTSLSAVDNGYC